MAREEAGSTGLLAAQQAALAAEHAAQLAVAQDSLRAMRQEVNERWVSSLTEADWFQICSAFGAHTCCLAPAATATPSSTLDVLLFPCHGNCN